MAGSAAERDLRVVEGVRSREIAGETLLVPVRGELAKLRQIYSLNPVAALVWEQLLEGSSRGELVEAIVARYEVSTERAGADLDALLEGLAARGLLATPG